MPSERGRQSKILLKENGVVSYNSKNNAYIFCRFFSNVAGSLRRNFDIRKTNSQSKPGKNIISRFVSHNVKVISFEMILKNFDVAKASRISQISAKFLKDGVPVIATHLTNIINLPIKLDTSPWKRKI